MKRIISLVLVCVMLVGCAFTLSSCGGPNSDPMTASKNLKDAGYIVVPIDAAGIGGIEKSISAYKIGSDDAVQIFYLSEDADFDEAYGYVEALFDEAKENNKDINVSIGKSGNMIWFGTKDAIKAAK